MRIALDARTLQDRPAGGIGRQLACLLPHLARDAELQLLTDGRRPAVDSNLPQHALTSRASARGVAWLQLAAPRWLTEFAGIFHCPFYGLPYRQPVPMVVTIHDLTFEDHPEWFSRARRAVFRAQARHAARTARRILTVSDHVRRCIVDRYGVRPEQVLVSPPGVPPIFRPDPDRDQLARLLDSLGVREPYVVAIGGAPRRALDVAIAAWRQVRIDGADASLVVVGKEEAPPEPGLVNGGPIDDSGWALLLAGAAALCYPTRYEGFGMPALEAAASGTPVVCPPVGALPEVLGPAAAWCDSGSPRSVAAALLQLLEDGSRAKELRDAGLEVARARHGWAPAAAVTLRAYREAEDG